MKKQSERPDWNELREKVLGLGERSMHKSYYPALQERLSELELFRKLLDLTHDIILLIEIPSQRIIDANKEALRFLGIEKDLLVEKTIYDFIGDSVKPALETLLFSEESTGHTHELLVQASGRSGTKESSERVLELTISIDSDKEQKFALAILHDITDMVRIRMALEKSEENYRQLVELSPFATLVYADDHIVFANIASMNLFGATFMSQVIGKNLESFIENESDNPVNFCVEDRKSLYFGDSGARKFHETKFRRLDGTVIQVEISCMKLTYQDTPATLIVLNDITERRKAEKERELLMEQLHQSQKLDALGALAGGIAHDFNNVLGIIMGAAQMALEETDKSSPAFGDIQQIMKASDRARELVGQILSFSRQREIFKEPINLNDILVDTVKMLRASLPTTIDIKVDVKPDEKSIINADPTQIRQVILNLCTNAAHAMKESGGLLHLSLAEVTFEVESLGQTLKLEPGRYFKLNVNDNGVGMDADTLKKVFDPFFTTKQVGEGTGLGLTLVHRIVKNHGGGVSIYSKPKIGTSVSVYFPAVGEIAFDAEEENAPQISKGQGHILLVDDEPMLIEMGKRIIGRLGYKVTGITDSVEAYAMFADSPLDYDLVITDMTMPRLTGLKLAEKILAIRPEIPVIISSGFTDTATADKAFEIGVREFLLKPVGKLELSQAIERALSQS